MRLLRVFRGSGVILGVSLFEEFRGWRFQYITGASDSSFRGLGFGFLKWLLLEKMEGFPFEVARSLRGDTGRGTGIGEQVGG